MFSREGRGMLASMPSITAQPGAQPERPTASPLGTRRAARVGARLALRWASLCLRYTRLPRSRRELMRYRIALHQSEEGFSVSVPGLPGCWSQGVTEVEALENVKDAIREYLAVIDEQLRGEKIREIEVVV